MSVSHRSFSSVLNKPLRPLFTSTLKSVYFILKLDIMNKQFKFNSILLSNMMQSYKHQLRITDKTTITPTAAPTVRLHLLQRWIHRASRTKMAAERACEEAHRQTSAQWFLIVLNQIIKKNTHSGIYKEETHNKVNMVHVGGLFKRTD